MQLTLIFSGLARRRSIIYNLIKTGSESAYQVAIKPIGPVATVAAATFSSAISLRGAPTREYLVQIRAQDIVFPVSQQNKRQDRTMDAKITLCVRPPTLSGKLRVTALNNTYCYALIGSQSQNQR
jgi:hypothetical protein